MHGAFLIGRDWRQRALMLAAVGVLFLVIASLILYALFLR